MAELLDFDCPRCTTSVQERFYGPCTSCRDQLRASHDGSGHQVAVADYTPKMNVTPNFVATKE